MSLTDIIEIPAGALALFVLAGAAIGACIAIAITTPWRRIA